jgi:hypothetical protein
VNIGRYQVNLFWSMWAIGNMRRRLIAVHPSYDRVFAWWWQVGPFSVRRFVK